jgi:hypothetical protein
MRPNTREQTRENQLLMLSTSFRTKSARGGFMGFSGMCFDLSVFVADPVAAGCSDLIDPNVG